MKNLVMKLDSFQTSAAAVDIEIHVASRWSQGKLLLEYTVSSPSGVVDLFAKKISSEPLNSPDSFEQVIYSQLDKLLRGLDLEDRPLFLPEIEKELKAIGHSLYHHLFPAEMRRCYLQFRNQARTVLIASDEPWIPWELVHPIEDDDDDFLCMSFQLSRWLGEAAPVAMIPLKHLACVEARKVAGYPSISHAEEERQALDRFKVGIAEVMSTTLTDASFEQVEKLLETGTFNLLHVMGHGAYSTTRADESTLELVDRPFRVHHLGGAIERRLRTGRPFIFMNSCRAARKGYALSGLGGWAVAWIGRCRCGAFLAPQWAVSDQCACKFADYFYEELKQEKTFGEATLMARRRLREVAPGDPSWLAYSLFAHPNGRLVFEKNHVERIVVSQEPSLLPSRRRFLDRIFEILATRPILSLLAQADQQQEGVIKAILGRARSHYRDNIFHINPPFDPHARVSQYLRFLARQCKFPQDINNAFDWECAIEDQLRSKGEIFLLITGLEKGSSEGRRVLAGILRNLCSRHSSTLRVVLCGGEGLAELKYASGELSLLNVSERLTWPELDSADILAWQGECFPALELDELAAEELLELSGGHPKLVEYLFQSWYSDHEVDFRKGSELLKTYSFIYQLFVPYRGKSGASAQLCRWLEMEDLGSVEPWLVNPLLRQLYWKNLLMARDGRLRWRCEVLRMVGQDVLGVKLRNFDSDEF